jgi:hypothetical protein
MVRNHPSLFTHHLVEGIVRLVATAATPLIFVIAELAYVAEGKESPDAFGLWLMVLPALALAGLSVWLIGRRAPARAPA